MATAVDIGGHFKDKDALTRVRDTRPTLGELLQVIGDLLPDEVELCMRLLRSLGGSGRVASSPLGQDFNDMYKVLSQFIESEPGSTDHSTLQKFQQQVKRKAVPSSEHDLGGNRKAQDGGTQDYLSCAGSETAEGQPLQDRPLPWVPARSEGSWRWRVFVVLEHPSSSILGKLMEALLIIVIVVSTVSFVMESIPGYRSAPDECQQRRDDGRPLTVEACEPRPDRIFFVIEAVCISFFTIEYLGRVLTVHADPASGSSGWMVTWRYAKLPLNVIDLIAILPFYIDAALGGDSNFDFVRVLRLVRILRLFKMAKHHPGMQMFVEATVMSGQPLLVLVFFNAIVGVIFASLMFSAEGQRYSVSEQFVTRPDGAGSDCADADSYFPTGVYVRRDSQLENDIVSPFRSIPYSMWWVAVTMTTVGYGDLVPTTVVGKMIGVVCFYVGIILLAMPIGVLSTNFELVYTRFRERSAKAAERQKAKRQSGFRSRVSAWGTDDIAQPPKESVRRTIFVHLQDPKYSQLSRMIGLCLFITIFVSVVTFVMESMPEFSHTPSECSTHLSVSNCTPEPDPAFLWIEVSCTILFTADYALRVLTVHSVRPAEAGIIVEEEEATSAARLTLRYCLQPMNIIDLLSVIPFYVELAGSDGRGAAVLKVLRLIRVFRVLKTPKLRACVDMFLSVLVDSLPAIFILVVLTALMCVFFAACIVFAEGSEYSVDHCPELYPTGVYVRPTPDGHGKEVTPFTSILYAFWWFFTTATTVGYGDDFPTTTAGRCIGVLTSYTGIILLALPVTIVGGSFNKYYPDWVAEFEPKRASIQRASILATSLQPLPTQGGCDSHTRISQVKDEYGRDSRIAIPGCPSGESEQPETPMKVRRVIGPPAVADTNDVEELLA